ncbi:MAG: Asp23/Gls24 family envelope stress response protein [Eubacterium sp.]|nr:Asp23/Gls24 family envelope stress response protein [Eubacterium sp.]
MADNIKENIFVIQSDEGEGIIQLADYVVTSIVALAVTEVDGVSKLTGDITRDLIAMLGKKSLSKGIRVVYDENKLRVAVSVEIKYGYNIVDVSTSIQKKVKQSLYTMTGLECDVVNVRVSGIDFSE